MTGTAGGRAARMMVALGLMVAACGCSSSAGDGSVSILVAWSGAELRAFEGVIATFEATYKIHVNVEGTRGLSEELGADLEERDPPDVAALPSIGAASQYAAAGDLKPLHGVISTADYGPPWTGLMRAGMSNGQVYAVPVKIDVKSLLWYDPSVFTADGYNVSAISSWSGLLSMENSIEAIGGSPFCMGMASPPTSGWPGADWIADILLSKYGKDTYQQWVSGKLSWTSGPVEESWKMWAQLLDGGNAVYGGRQGALTTSVDDLNPYELITVPGTCYLEHGTLVDENFLPKLNYGTDYSFVPFPALGAQQSPPIQVSADFIGMFNASSQAKQLIRYLTSTPVQTKLVGSPGLDGFSADNKVPLSAYAKDGQAMTRIAGLLSQRELCFGAADAMPPDLEAAFDQAILEYIADPPTLSSMLHELEAEQDANVSSSLQVCD
jgi:alpha-glucoside transport system substrate-binding protein